MSNSILFSTTKAVVTSFLNEELWEGGIFKGVKDADSLEPLKEKYVLKPLASLSNVSDETMDFFWSDLLHYFNPEKKVFLAVSEIVTSETDRYHVDRFLAHSMLKLVKRAFPLKIKALLNAIFTFSNTKKYNHEERAELRRQFNELCILNKQFREKDGKCTIVAMVV